MDRKGLIRNLFALNCVCDLHFNGMFRNLTLLLFGLLLLSLTPSKAQIDNWENIGFEKNGLSGWNLSYGELEEGTSRPVFVNEITSFTNDQHMLVTRSQGLDANVSEENIPKVIVPGNNALRLGNTSNGGTFSKASTQFVVKPWMTSLQYAFAVVLQNDEGNHTPSEKPGFSLKITKAGGESLTCGEFDVQLSTDPNSGFKSEGEIVYRNWTTGIIDLTPFIGQTLRIDLQVFGCTGRRHFGYAYFDAQFRSDRIEQAAPCPDASGRFEVSAPPGFERYIWEDGQQGRSIQTLSTLGADIGVLLIPASTFSQECRVSLRHQFKPFVSDTTFSKTICKGEVFKVSEEEYSEPGTYQKLIKRGGYCDSTVIFNLSVREPVETNLSINRCFGETVTIADSSIQTSGEYFFKIKRPQGCDSLINARVYFEKAGIKPLNDTLLTQGDNLVLEAVPTGGSFTESIWEVNGEVLCKDCLEVELSPAKTETYIFRYQGGEGFCSEADSVRVTVLPCQLYLPTAFSPNEDSFNPLYFARAGPCVDLIESFVIYNRQGDEVYRKESIQPSDEMMGWDGRYNGSTVQPGNYPFEVKYRLVNGLEVKDRGSITVLK